MLRIFVALASVVLLVGSCGTATTNFQSDSRTVSSVDATNAWNSVCAQYHFIPKPSDRTTTFAQGYFGHNFLADDAAITNAVNLITLNVTAPTSGNDVMSIKIENWGLLGGGL